MAFFLQKSTDYNTQCYSATPAICILQPISNKDKIKNKVKDYIMDENQIQTAMKEEATIVLGIPGLWKDRDAILEAIATKSGGYTYGGMLLTHTKNNDSFGLEIYEHDDKLREAFEYAGMGRFSDDELNQLDKHTFILYVIGAAGSTDAAQKMMHVATALLEAGGLAVKVETAGKAFNVEQWKTLTNLDDPARFYDAFVTKLQVQDDVFYTCGMHNLGFKDAIVGAVGLEAASHTLDVFSIYQIVEQPEIHTGEWFAVDEALPKFQLLEEKDTRYPKDDGFFNRHGLWIMRPAIDFSE